MLLFMWSAFNDLWYVSIRAVYCLTSSPKRIWSEYPSQNRLINKIAKQDRQTRSPKILSRRKSIVQRWMYSSFASSCRRRTLLDNPVMSALNPLETANCDWKCPPVTLVQSNKPSSKSNQSGGSTDYWFRHDRYGWADKDWNWGSPFGTAHDEAAGSGMKFRPTHGILDLLVPCGCWNV